MCMWWPEKTSNSYALLHFAPEEYTKVQNKIVEIDHELSLLEEKANDARARLQRERAKMDDFSVDLSLMTK